ncbi:MAG: nucleotide-binding protein, partial [Flavobacteriales bacterium CG_4_10_14_0_2_um_filter_32_8]
VTTTHEVNLGDIITIKGRISLDKDFGYGYFYDVIMEDAEIIK